MHVKSKVLIMEERLKGFVCYLCGHDSFSISDVHQAQTERTINEHGYNLIPYVVCPGCGFTVEV